MTANVNTGLFDGNDDSQLDIELAFSVLASNLRRAMEGEKGELSLEWLLGTFDRLSIARTDTNAWETIFRTINDSDLDAIDKDAVARFLCDCSLHGEFGFTPNDLLKCWTSLENIPTNHQERIKADCDRAVHRRNFSRLTGYTLHPRRLGRICDLEKFLPHTNHTHFCAALRAYISALGPEEPRYVEQILLGLRTYRPFADHLHATGEWGVALAAIHECADAAIHRLRFTDDHKTLAEVELLHISPYIHESDEHSSPAWEDLHVEHSPEPVIDSQCRITNIIGTIDSQLRALGLIGADDRLQATVTVTVNGQDVDLAREQCVDEIYELLGEVHLSNDSEPDIDIHSKSLDDPTSFSFSPQNRLRIASLWNPPPLPNIPPASVTLITNGQSPCTPDTAGSTTSFDVQNKDNVGDDCDVQSLEDVTTYNELLRALVFDDPTNEETYDLCMRIFTSIPAHLQEIRLRTLIGPALCACKFRSIQQAAMAYCIEYHYFDAVRNIISQQPNNAELFAMFFIQLTGKQPSDVQSADELLEIAARGDEARFTATIEAYIDSFTMLSREAQLILAEVKHSCNSSDLSRIIGERLFPINDADPQLDPALWVGVSHAHTAHQLP